MDLAHQAGRIHCSTNLADLPYLRYVGTRSTGAATDGICYRKALWGAVEREQLVVPLITKPDEVFEKQGLEFVYDTDQLAVEELIELFQKVGFPKRNAESLTKALDASHKLIWIRHAKQTRWARLGQLLGFARATSDKAVSATIWDVAVNPLWQRGGLGRGLVERLVAALVEDGVNAVTLYAEPNVVRMYEKLGFLQDPSKVQGLSFQRSSPAGAALVASCKA
ncbi:hypothetical protein WJX73_005810 [Symbiochloris irregularis]|uniref:N-acetyltransferase domain-containing protein n=1 Tax=Symbiochloris irregularis TaxID=706552 RepID=A0AAW1NRZ4_9CHLO